MKAAHEKKVLELKEAIESKKHPDVTFENIEQYRHRLLQLKHSGPQIRQIISVVDTFKQEERKAKPMDRVVDYTKQVGSAIVSGIKNASSKFIDGAKKIFSKLWY